jgi:hypothetical protein
VIKIVPVAASDHWKGFIAVDLRPLSASRTCAILGSFHGGTGVFVYSDLAKSYRASCIISSTQAKICQI